MVSKCQNILKVWQREYFPIINEPLDVNTESEEEQASRMSAFLKCEKKSSDKKKTLMFLKAAIYLTQGCFYFAILASTKN